MNAIALFRSLERKLIAMETRFAMPAASAVTGFRHAGHRQWFWGR